MNNKIGVISVKFSNNQKRVAGASNLPDTGGERMRKFRQPGLFWLALVAAGCLLGNFSAQSYTTNLVEKVADLSSYTDTDGVVHGSKAPLDRFTQVGTNLWFTTSRGGAYDLGTVSRFELPTHQWYTVADLSANSGARPESTLLVVGNEGYFTTVSVGVSNKGTIAKIDLDSGTVTPVFAFPNSGLPTGASPRGNLTQIGNDLWTLTSLGGTSNRGVVLKYNLTSGLATLVTNLDGPLLGGQAFDGFTTGSNAWYFVTYSGGSSFKTTNYPVAVLPDGSTAIITNVLPLGAGTLGQLTFDSLGNPVVNSLFSLPGGFEEFPAVAPTLVGTNSLYFTSTGPNALPGAILRYDLNTGYFTNLFSFSTNPIPSVAYGTRPGYSGLVEWLGELYFINRSGGTNGAGTVAKFNIASNAVVKLTDLGNPDLSNDLGSPSGFFGSGTIVQETNRFFIYYPLTTGGVNSAGTIIRVALPPLPIQAGVQATSTNAVLSWSGGYPPFDVVSNSDLTVPVANWPVAVSGITSVTNTTNWSVALPATNGAVFYRVKGQAQ